LENRKKLSFRDNVVNKHNQYCLKGRNSLTASKQAESNINVAG